MKSLTPVVSIIILILLTVASAGAAYFFVFSSVNELQSGGIQTPAGITGSRLQIVSVTGVKSIIRNDGTSSVNEVLVFVNGELLNYTLTEPLLPGEFLEIPYNARKAGEDLEVQIIYPGGTSRYRSPASANTPPAGFVQDPVPLNEPTPEPEWPTEWLMLGKYANRTSWDGKEIEAIEGANRRVYEGDSAISEATPAVINEYVYLGNSGGKLYQLNATNIRQLIAHYNIGSYLSSPAVANGYVYVGSEDYKIYQLNASDVSELIATYETGNYIYSSPAIANDYVYASSTDNKIYQLNASNVSQLIASYATGGQIWSSPAVINSYVYVGSRDNKLYQLNANNVSQSIANFSAGGEIWSSPAVANGYVYIGSSDNKIYQLNATNISQSIANFTTIGGGYSSPTVANNYVYIGAEDIVYQLNASNISQSINTFNLSGSATACTAANGYIYVGTYGDGSDDTVYQLNASNISQSISSYEIGDQIWFSSAATNDYIYVGSNNGNIYQLNANDVSLGNIPSPAPELPEPLTCGIEFTDTEAPIVQVVLFTDTCLPCESTPNSGIYLKINVTDDSPIREVIYENAGLGNFSLTQLGNTGNYSFTGEPRTGGYDFGTNYVYAIDWNYNIVKTDIGATPDTSAVCSVASCKAASAALDSHSHSPETICLGESFTINATANSESGIRNILLKLENPDSSYPDVTEYIYFDNLAEDSWGVSYYPKYRGVYNLTIISTSTSDAITHYYLGNISLYE
ncbi:MAG: PQQ-binding-like beta-propeller repeat protein [Candidatus Nanoarchaeia archaeon]|nr:PQQ-binding-like beta-propeller repeat protein [Candidatus Nanoarchaeia archaeon]